MGNGLKERQRLISKYGPLYKRIDNFDLSKCAYCATERQCLDHVPAISRLEGINIKVYIKRGGKFLLYPSCNQCNKLLNNTEAVYYYERLTLLEQKYSKKVDKIELWSDEELSEMGRTMRAYIEGNQYKVSELTLKLRAVQEQMFRIEIGELTEDGLPGEIKI